MPWYIETSLTPFNATTATEWEISTQSAKRSGAPEKLQIDPEDLTLDPEDVQADDENWTIQSGPED